MMAIVDYISLQHRKRSKAHHKAAAAVAKEQVSARPAAKRVDETQLKTRIISCHVYSAQFSHFSTQKVQCVHFGSKTQLN